MIDAIVALLTQILTAIVASILAQILTQIEVILWWIFRFSSNLKSTGLYANGL